MFQVTQRAENMEIIAAITLAKAFAISNVKFSICITQLQWLTGKVYCMIKSKICEY